VKDKNPLDVYIMTHYKPVNVSIKISENPSDLCYLRAIVAAPFKVNFAHLKDMHGGPAI
jgi:hypothetical protein